jgi:hypothetical protein
MKLNFFKKSEKQVSENENIDLKTEKNYEDLSPAEIRIQEENEANDKKLKYEIQIENIYQAFDDLNLNLSSPGDLDFLNRIVKESSGKSIEDLMSEKPKDSDLLKQYDHFMSSLESLISSPKEKNISIFEPARKLFASKAGKLAFVSFLLFAKFSPAMAGETKNNSTKTDANKIEAKASDAHKSENGKTIKYEPKISGEHGEHNGPLKLDLSNSFETAKAEISPENQKNIEQTFTEFLSKINKDNYKQFAFSNWAVEGSSDERPISIEGGNNKLTHDRVNSLKPFLQKVLDKFDFSRNGLSHTEIESLKHKVIGEKIPNGGEGREAGVTYLTDLNNPSTGQHYTAEEINAIKTNNPDKYQDLLKECRYTKLNLESTGEYTNALTQAGQAYDKVTMLIDKSGSMFDSKDYIADNIEKNIKDDDSHNGSTKYAIGFFSDALHSLEEAGNLKDACHKIKAEHTLGYAHEKMLSSTVSALETILEANHGQKVEGRQVLVVATDEAIQDVSVNNLKAIKDLSTKTGVEVKLLMGIDENNRVVEVSIDDLMAKAQDLMNRSDHGVTEKMARLQKTSPNKLTMEDQKFMKNFDKEMIAFEKQEHEVRNFEFNNNGQVGHYEAPVY